MSYQDGALCLAVPRPTRRQLFPRSRCPGQGYLFALPLSAEDAYRRLAAETPRIAV
jgi:hypothetical protein